MSEILIFQGDEQTGPFQLEEIQQRLQQGTLSANDYAWMEGQPDWRPLHELIDIEIVSEVGQRIEPGTPATQPASVLTPLVLKDSTLVPKASPLPLLPQGPENPNPRPDSSVVRRRPLDRAMAVRIKKYFRGESSLLPWLLILIGIPLLCLYGLGLIPLVIGIVMLNGSSSYLPDAQVEAWIKDIFDGHDFVARAREMSNFAEFVRPPIYLYGLASEHPYQYRIGDDARIRTNPMSVSVLLASPDQLGVYQTDVDVVTGNRVHETYFEVFYQDVIAITLAARTLTEDLEDSVRTAKKLENSPLLGFFGRIQAGKERKDAERIRNIFREHILADILQVDDARLYVISFTDGNRVTIPVMDGRLTEIANREAFIRENDSMAQAMYSFRMFVRDKKRGFLRKEIAG